MSQEISTYESLDVWKFSMELVQEVYDLTEHFPEVEQMVLLKEIRVAAIRVPAKIAAGHSCGRSGMMFRFYCYGLANLGKLETGMGQAVRLNYIPKLEAKPVFEKCKKIRKLIEKMILPADLPDLDEDEE